LNNWSVERKLADEKSLGSQKFNSSKVQKSAQKGANGGCKPLVKAVEKEKS